MSNPKSATSEVSEYTRLGDIMRELDITDDPLVPETDLRDALGIDSAELVEIIVALTDGADIDMKRVRELKTAGDLVTLLSELRSSASGQQSSAHS